MRSPCYVKYFYLLVEKPKLTALRTTSAQNSSTGGIYTFERPVKPSVNVKHSRIKAKACSFGLIMPIFIFPRRTYPYRALNSLSGVILLTPLAMLLLLLGSVLHRGTKTEA